MKPYHILLAFLLVSAWGCGSIREKEPNDHFSCATLIKPNRVIEGRISSPDDLDIFKLDNSRDNSILSFYLEGVKGVDFVIGILDEDRQELKRFDETSTGGDEQVLDVGMERGSYYISLSNKNGKAKSLDGEYKFKVSVQSARGNEMEPNDRLIFATPLNIDGVTRGHYFPSHNLLEGDGVSECDWFVMKILESRKQLMNIDLSGVPKIDPIMEIYDINSYKIKEVDSSGAGEGERLKNFGVEGPVRYYLKLRSKMNYAGNADIPYEILTEIIPYTGRTEFEHNDQRLEATPFGQDEITGNIAPEGDIDWYKVVVQEDAKQIMRVTLSGLAGMDLQLRFCDDMGNTLAFVDNQGREKPEIVTGMGVTKGEYYLVVGEKSGRKSNSRDAYKLEKTVSSFQTGLEFELNNSWDSVQPLKLGESVDGYIAPKGDKDWYEINVYTGGNVIFEVAGILNVQLQMTVYDQDRAQILDLRGEKPGESLAAIRTLEAGTYSIELKAANPEENNVRDKYTLRTRIR